jgi:hypothetical protein
MIMAPATILETMMQGKVELLAVEVLICRDVSVTAGTKKNCVTFSVTAG